MSQLIDGYILEGGDGKVYRLQDKSADWAYNLAEWCVTMEKLLHACTPQSSKVTLTTSPWKSLKSAASRSSRRSIKSSKSTRPPESVTILLRSPQSVKSSSSRGPSRGQSSQVTTTSSPSSCPGVATPSAEYFSFDNDSCGGGFEAFDDGSRRSTLTLLSRGSCAVSVKIQPHPRAILSDNDREEAPSLRGGPGGVG